MSNSSRAAAFQTKKTRLFSSHKKKRTTIKPTSAECAQAKARRQAERNELKDALRASRCIIMQEAVKLREHFGGHSVDYYYEKLMQLSRINRGKCSVNLWNAFLALEVKNHNEDLDDGERHLKVSEISHAASVKWTKMSLDEQKAAASPGIALIKDAREVKLLAKCNTPLAAIQDAHKTLKNLENEMRALCARTGVESFLVTVRSKPDQHGKPFATVSSHHGDDFFKLAVRKTMPEFALRFEAFCLSGVQGVTGNYIQQTLEMKHELAKLVLACLRDAAGTHVPRMYYKNFDDNITAKYGVVVVNWPLDKFCNPSDLPSRTEVSLLLASFQSGTTHFEKLSVEAFAAWEEKRFTDAVQATTGPPEEPPASSPASPSTASRSASSPEPSSAHPPASMSTPATTSTAPATAPAAPENAMLVDCPPLTSNFINLGITGADGRPISVTKKARKERSDKGKKHGKCSAKE